LRTVDGAVLDVDPSGVRAGVAALQRASLVAAAQRRVCDGIEVAAGDPGIRVGLGAFTASWGSAVTGLARELELLGVELGKSVDGVVAVDRAGGR